MKIMRLGILFFLLTASLGRVFALGVGELDVESGLNEPFLGRISLISDTREEFDALTVGLADNNAFRQAGIERFFILGLLKFELITPEEGNNYIRVSSQEPIREPFLNFLVEINWSQGRVLREYVVLLDPLLYEPDQPALPSTATIHAPETSHRPITETIEDEAIDTEISRIEDPIIIDTPKEEAPGDERATFTYDEDDTSEYDDTNIGHVVHSAEDFDRYTTPRSTDQYSDTEYGPIQKSETLWSIAHRLRPNNNISVNQMMLALFYANPKAFIDQNINGLKQGKILRIPSESELYQLNKAEAFAEAKAQHDIWNQLHADAMPTVTTQPDISSRGTADSGERTNDNDVAILDTDAEFRLVAATTDEENQGVSPGTEEGTNASGLILAQESIEALTLENAELKNQLDEADRIINDLQRLLEIQNDELANLQSGLPAEDEQSLEEASEPAIEHPTEDESLEGELLDEETAIESSIAPPVEDESLKEESPSAETTPTGLAEDLATEDPGQTPEAPITEVAEDTTPAQAVEPPIKDPTQAAEPEAKGVDQQTTAPETRDVAQQTTAPETGILAFISAFIAIITGGADNISLINIVIITGGIVLAIIIGLALMRRYKNKTSQEMSITIQDRGKDFQEEDIGLIVEEDVQKGDQLDSKMAASTSSDTTRLFAEEESKDDEFLQEEPQEEIIEDAADSSLQEVNAYLAFEQFEQAENFVRELIEQAPDNLDYRMKLMEIFYTAANKEAYEDEAGKIRDLVGEQSEHWTQINTMWGEISPTRKLFEQADNSEEGPAVDPREKEFVDLTTDEQASEDNAILDFNIDQDDNEIAKDADILSIDSDNEASDDGGLDWTENNQDKQEELADDATDMMADDSADNDNMLILDPSHGEDDNDSMMEKNEEILDITTSTDLDFEADLLDLTEDLSRGPEKSSTNPLPDDAKASDLQQGEIGEIGDTNMDLQAMDMDSTVEIPNTDENPGQNDGIEITDIADKEDEENATKLDLAKAYVELGDKENAKTILNEVISTGNNEQRTQAEELLSQV